MPEGSIAAAGEVRTPVQRVAFKVTEAAEIAGTSPRQVQRRCRARSVAHLAISARCTLIPAGDIGDLFAEAPLYRADGSGADTIKAAYRGPKRLTMPQVAGSLGVSVRVLYDWIAQLGLPVETDERGTRYVQPAALRRWLLEHRRPARWEAAQ